MCKAAKRNFVPCPSSRIAEDDGYSRYMRTACPRCSDD
jgi:hypothetical protein